MQSCAQGIWAGTHRALTLAITAGGLTFSMLSQLHVVLFEESDVYSFGVVLFEVLCGTFCCTYDKNGFAQQKFVPTWIESYYKEKKLNDVIFKDPTLQPLNQSALETLSDIAYRCLNESREDRPTMPEVVRELETALVIQELNKSEKSCDWKESISYYKGITMNADPPLNYMSTLKLWVLLSKWVLLNEGKIVISCYPYTPML
ncbi:putative protein kinase RLK-Pelle-SD-2b family [Helianthus anomalus]